MSEIHRFPIVTMGMIITTGVFIFLYMVTSHVLFYDGNSLKFNLDRMTNSTMSGHYKTDALNNSDMQKEFFQYGMVTSVILCPVCAYFEIMKRGNNKKGE